MDRSESPSVEQVVRALDYAARYIADTDGGVRMSGDQADELVRDLRSLAASYPLQQAELGRLREDAARLDWLESTLKAGTIDTYGEFDERAGCWFVDDQRYDSLRTAFDAARGALSGEER